MHVLSMELFVIFALYVTHVYGSNYFHLQGQFTFNKTLLCSLKGGSCVTSTTSCVGQLSFSCTPHSEKQKCCLPYTTLSSPHIFRPRGFTPSPLDLTPITRGFTPAPPIQSSMEKIKATLKSLKSKKKRYFKRGKSKMKNHSRQLPHAHNSGILSLLNSGYGKTNFGYGSHLGSVINGSTLCLLQGGECVSSTTQCAGTLKFICDSASGGLCCFNTTSAKIPTFISLDKHSLTSHHGKSFGHHSGHSSGHYGHSSGHHGYGSSHFGHSSGHFGHSSGGYGHQNSHSAKSKLHLNQVNQTALCVLSGGRCVTTTTDCPGVLQFVCGSLSAGICCYDTNPSLITHSGSHNSHHSSGYGSHNKVDFGLKLTLNKTSLCELKGGACTTDITSCVGKLSFVCDNLSGGICCFNTTVIHTHSITHHHDDHYGQKINKTILCEVKGGICTFNTVECIGPAISNCDDLSICCLNNTNHKELHIRQFVVPPYKPQQRPSYSPYSRPQRRRPSYGGYGGSGFGGSGFGGSRFGGMHRNRYRSRSRYGGQSHSRGNTGLLSSFMSLISFG